MIMWAIANHFKWPSLKVMQLLELNIVSFFAFNSRIRFFPSMGFSQNFNYTYGTLFKPKNAHINELNFLSIPKNLISGTDSSEIIGPLFAFIMRGSKNVN